MDNNEIVFSKNQSVAIWDALNKIPSNYDQEENPLDFESLAANILNETIEKKMVLKIKEKVESNHSPYLLIRNFLSIKDLPPTPTDDRSPDSRGWRVPAAALMGLLRLTGHSARSFLDEMNGRLCHMVMPAKNDDRSYKRSTKELLFHTEVVNGYFIEENPCIGQPVSPESFGLIGLRNPDNISTTLLPLRSVLAKLEPETINELLKPIFHSNSQSSFDRNICIDNIPVLKVLNDGAMGIRYSHSKLTTKDKNGIEALKILTELINSSRKTLHISLNPGDILLINNRTSLHGRTTIASSAKFSGLDRWLLRVYGYKLSTLPVLKTQNDKKHVMEVTQ